MPVPSQFDHLGAIDPVGVAKRLGADGYGIVWAVVGSGIHGTHPHFIRYENLDLTPPLRHRDFTVALSGAHDSPLGPAPMSDQELSDEALFDGQGDRPGVSIDVATFATWAPFDRALTSGIALFRLRFRPPAPALPCILEKTRRAMHKRRSAHQWD
jgi:hypothetical protein